MGEQIRNTRDVMRVIRRHLWLVIGTTLLGLALGLAYATFAPSLPSSETLVLLPPSSLGSSAQSTRDEASEAQIARSEVVVVAAARKAGLVPNYEALVHRIAVTAVTDEVLQITAQAPTARLAGDFANALAASLVDYSNSTSGTSNQSTSALEQQSALLGNERVQVQNEISATTKLLAGETVGSVDARNAQRLLTILRQIQSDVSLVNSTVTTAIAQATQNSASGTAVAVLQEAIPMPPSAERTTKLGGLGGLGGLVVGVVAALALDVRDQRLRRRDSIAAVVEAPVLQSLSPQRPKTVKDWQHVFQRWQPSNIDRAHLRKVMDDLGILDGRQLTPFDLTVIALAGDRYALTVAPELGVFAALLGLSVSFVVGTDHESTSRLRKACAKRDRDPKSAGRGLLTYDRRNVEQLQSAITVTLVVVDPKSTDLVDWSYASLSNVDRAEATILAVSSGFAVAEDLVAVTSSAARNMHRVRGVVITNPDPSDRTAGLATSVRSHAPRTVAR